MEDEMSDDSSFYGDGDYVAGLEERASSLDIENYWKNHDRDLNVIVAKARSEPTPAPTKPPLPKGGLHNRYEGLETAWQLHETVDDFLTRCPVITSAPQGPWLWAANPYSAADAEPEVKSAIFMSKATTLLENYRGHKAHVEKDSASAAPATITRKLIPAKAKLKDDILSLAKDAKMTSGKWMLFPTEEDATQIWKEVVARTIEGQLGVAAKIATDGATRLICIYTRDFSDLADVKRVVQQIESMELLPADPSKSIYYKCDAYTHLDIGSANEFGLQASLYSSRDVLTGASKPAGSTAKPSSNQKRISDFATSKSAKRRA